MVLSPEEVTLLLEKKAIRLVQSPCLLREPSTELKKTYEEYKQKLIAEQSDFLKGQQKLRVCTIWIWIVIYVQIGFELF